MAALLLALALLTANAVLDAGYNAEVTGFAKVRLRVGVIGVRVELVCAYRLHVLGDYLLSFESSFKVVLYGALVLKDHLSSLKDVGVSIVGVGVNAHPIVVNQLKLIQNFLVRVSMNVLAIDVFI